MSATAPTKPRRRRWPAILVILGSIVLGIIGVSVTRNNDEPAQIAQDVPVTTTTMAPTTTTSPSSEVTVNPESLRTLFDGDVAADELAFNNEAKALMATADQERSSAAHSDHTLTTPQELVTWLDSGDPKAGLVKDRVINAITAQCGAADVDVHLKDAKNWLLMVVKPQSEIHGTSYVQDGNIQFVDGYRRVGENDAYWLPVCSDGGNKGDVVANGMVRADCGNGSENPKIHIIRPDTPWSPPITCVVDCQPPEVPKCPNGTPVPPNGLCPKYQPENIDRNSNGPQQVTQPDPNKQLEINKGPQAPQDTPTGCAGKCDPLPRPTPSTPPTTRQDESRGEPRPSAPTTIVAPPPAPATTVVPPGGTPGH